MKKLLVFLVTLPLTAFAQVTANYSFGIKNLDNGQQAHQNVLSLLAPVRDHVAVDAVFNSDVNDKTKVLTMRYELGLDLDHKFLDNYTATLRTALGEKQKSGTQPFPYYVIEPGVNANLPYGFTARVAFRYRDAFNPVNKDQSYTMRYAIGYNVTDKDKLSIGYDVTKGDGASTTTSFRYSRKF